MKNPRKTILISHTLMLLSCTAPSIFKIENQENVLSKNNNSTNEDYWPFTKTLSTHDPFVSELLKSE